MTRNSDPLPGYLEGIEANLREEIAEMIAADPEADTAGFERYARGGLASLAPKSPSSPAQTDGGDCGRK